MLVDTKIPADNTEHIVLSIYYYTAPHNITPSSLKVYGALARKMLIS